MNDRVRYGVVKEHDKWYYRDPITKEQHGPFYNREIARQRARALRAARKKQHVTRAA